MRLAKIFVLFFLLITVPLFVQAREPTYKLNGQTRQNRAWNSFARKVARKSDLRMIIVSADQEFKILAAQTLLSGNPNTYDLIMIVRFLPGTVEQLSAATELLRRKLDIFDLVEIVCFVPEPHKGFAWQAFLRANPKNRDFWRVMICSGSGGYASQAAVKLFRKDDLTDEDLAVIAAWGPSRLAQEAVRVTRLRQTAHDRLMRVRVRSMAPKTPPARGERPKSQARVRAETDFEDPDDEL